MARRWIIVALALALTRPAAGEADEQRARALFRRAEVHFNLGEFAPAADLYRQAYRLAPLPGFLYNLAQCHCLQLGLVSPRRRPAVLRREQLRQRVLRRQGLLRPRLRR
jgi:tetratricopeptide (TPR) repeat protein